MVLSIFSRASSRGLKAAGRRPQALTGLGLFNGHSRVIVISLPCVPPSRSVRTRGGRAVGAPKEEKVIADKPRKDTQRQEEKAREERRPRTTSTVMPSEEFRDLLRTNSVEGLLERGAKHGQSMDVNMTALFFDRLLDVAHEASGDDDFSHVPRDPRFKRVVRGLFTRLAVGEEFEPQSLWVLVRGLVTFGFRSGDFGEYAVKTMLRRGLEEHQPTELAELVLHVRNLGYEPGEEFYRHVVTATQRMGIENFDAEDITCFVSGFMVAGFVPGLEWCKLVVEDMRRTGSKKYNRDAVLDMILSLDVLVDRSGAQPGDLLQWLDAGADKPSPVARLARAALRNPSAVFGGA